MGSHDFLDISMGGHDFLSYGGVGHFRTHIYRILTNKNAKIVQRDRLFNERGLFRGRSRLIG